MAARRSASRWASVIGSGISSRRLVGGVAEHQALVARALEVVGRRRRGRALLEGLVHALRDVRALLVDAPPRRRRCRRRSRTWPACSRCAGSCRGRSPGCPRRSLVVISPATTTCPVVISVSQATRPIGSSVEDGVEHASEIWSAILSGCPSVTDSEVKRCSAIDCAPMRPAPGGGNDSRGSPRAPRARAGSAGALEALHLLEREQHLEGRGGAAGGPRGDALQRPQVRQGLRRGVRRRPRTAGGRRSPAGG